MMAEHADLVAAWGATTIPFRLIREDRNTFRLTVAPDGVVCAYAPLSASDDEVAARVARRGGWVTRQRERFDQWRPRTPARQYVSGETHLFQGKQYRLAVRAFEGSDVRLEGDRIVLWTRPDASFVQRRVLLQHWYKLQAHQLFPPQLNVVWPRFSKLGVARPRLVIRLMSRRWGSFTSSGNLVLNAELVQASPHLLEYVVTHELAHGLHPHHGGDWQALMTEIMPDWRDRKADLERQLL